MDFSATILKIGINPYVLLPEQVLEELFTQAGKRTSPIPVQCTIEGHVFTQHLVRYQGKWRLYLNTPMRKAAGIDVGDSGTFSISFDPGERTIAMHPGLITALKKNKKAKTVFDGLAPSLQKEILRYIANLKTRESVERNIGKVIQFLLGDGRFIGRDGISQSAINTHRKDKRASF